MDGVHLGDFTVAGASNIRDMAYDGTYFYGSPATMTISIMDLANETLIGTIPVTCTGITGVRHIAFDPELDGGNGGFWVGNWYELGAITMSGAQIYANMANPSDLYGSAYDEWTDGGPYLWLFSQGGGAVLHQFDIAAQAVTGVTHDASDIPGFSAGIAGGLATYVNDDGLFVMLTNIQQSPNIIGVYEIAITADPAAPGAPTDVVVTPGAAGALECDINWTCPTLTYAGDPLTELLEMRIYRNGVLVYTDFSPVIGGAGSYTDFPTQAGMYNYVVVGFNSEGEGGTAHEEVWVGEDVPNDVTDLIITDVSTPTTLIAQLDWVNPTTGFHGGFFSGCTGYDIERSDGALFTIFGSTTQWQDDTIPTPGIYYYSVTPFNYSGYGPSTTAYYWGPNNIVQIGNQEVGDYQIPMNLYYMDSMVEVVYLQEWLGSDMLINTVSFHANTTSTLTDEFNIEVWLGETAETDLSSGWIDGTNMSQVFDGTLDVPTGDNWIDIPLNTSFVYTFSGNLVMMIIRDDDEYYSTADQWWCTESNTPYRTRHAYTDNSGGQEFNAITGPFTSTYNKSIYPDVRFYYSPLEHGDVSGVVTNSATSNPIEGVEVYIGSCGPATTNASGEYLIENIVTGLRPVTASKEGYYNFLGEVTVIENQNTVYDIAMEPNEFGTLDGTVTDFYTGNPLVGAEINAVSAGGYEYDALTNNAGYYSIVDVVAETYDVYCSYPNYPTDVEEDIIVLDGQTTTVDFTLELYSLWNDFENNDGGLISNNIDGWQWGIPSNGPSSAYSGVKLWGTVIGDNYPNSVEFTLDTPFPIYLDYNTYFSFWHWYDIEASYDGGNVKVSTDGGTTWDVITSFTGYTGTGNTANPLSGEPIFTGHNQMFWEEEVFDLSAYQGQSILIRWHFGSDSSVQYPGWFIDDVALFGNPIPNASLEGTVTKFGIGTPIEGATVSILSLGFNATSQIDGTYEIPGIWPGFYDITCVAPLYLDAEVLGYTIVEGINTLDFILLWSEIAVDVTELICYLPPDTIGTQYFTIINDGPGDLEFSMSVEYTDEVTLRTCPAITTNTTPREMTKTEYSHSDDLEFSPMETHVNGNLTEDIWDIQGSFRPIDTSDGIVSQAGMEFDGTYFYCPVWNSADICKYDIDGNFIETFQVAGVSGTRDLAYDGQYMYGGTSGSQIYCWDPVTYTLITTINSSQGLYRAIAYDSVNDGFLGNNWSGDIVCTARDGSTIYTIPDTGIASVYGMAYDNVSVGGQNLWLFSQAGSGAEIYHIDIASGLPTGIMHDALADFPSAGIAGGLWTSPDYVAGTLTIGGLVQGEDAFMYELTEPNWLGVSNWFGTIPGNGGTVEVQVTFNSAGLNVGDVLTANLLIHNNSNYGGDYVIPVTLIVEYVGSEPDVLPFVTKLSGNYPNPFNPATTISFSVAQTSSFVNLEIYNLKGQKVKTLVNEVLPAGQHSVIWDGKDENGKLVSSGVYFYKMRTGAYTSTKKMILLK